MASDADDARKSVKTYVPEYQKSEWETHASELEMSQSEFVRTMVQAGRSEFDIPALSSSADSDSQADNRPTDTSDSALDDRILSVLDEGEVLSWDELRDELMNDFESRLESVLDRLQETNDVRYNGRRGGYERRNHE